MLLWPTTVDSCNLNSKTTMISETPPMTIIPTTKIFAVQFSKADNTNMEFEAYCPNIYFVPPDIECTVRLA